MKRPILLSLLAALASIDTVNAAGESSVTQFLGSPLLILTVFLIIDTIAFVYYKLRK